MKLSHHIAASTAVSGLLYVLFKSWGLTASSFIFGIFIDLDHIFDVVREHGKGVSIKDFFHICHTAQFKRIYLICHGWEWLIAGLICAWYFNWDQWILGAVIGFTHHMVLDTIHNTTTLKTYSLLWRWNNNFVFDTCFKKMTKIKYTSIPN